MYKEKKLHLNCERFHFIIVKDLTNRIKTFAILVKPFDISDKFFSSCIKLKINLKFFFELLVKFYFFFKYFKLYHCKIRNEI